VNATAAALFALRATRPASLRSEGPVDAAGPDGAIDGADGRAANRPLEGGQRTPPPQALGKPANGRLLPQRPQGPGTSVNPRQRSRRPGRLTPGSAGNYRRFAPTAS
jgi:hypothetical protein